MAFDSDAITYFSHDRRWTSTLTGGTKEPFLMAHVDMDVTIKAGDTEVTADVLVNGYLWELLVDIPVAFTGTEVTITLTTENGQTLWIEDEIEPGQKSVIDVFAVCMGTTTITVTSNAVEAADRNINVAWIAGIFS